MLVSVLLLDKSFLCCLFQLFHKEDFAHFEDTMSPAIQDSQTGIRCVNYAWAQSRNEAEYWQHLNLGSKGAQVFF